MTFRRRWLLGLIGPVCLGIAAAFIVAFGDSSWWIIAALLAGAAIGRNDPWDSRGRPR